MYENIYKIKIFDVTRNKKGFYVFPKINFNYDLPILY